MEKRLPFVSLFVATLALAAGGSRVVSAAVVLNGGFEGGWTGYDPMVVAESWNATNRGDGFTWASVTGGTPGGDVHSGTQAQKMSKVAAKDPNFVCVYQQINGNVGDAFSLGSAWVKGVLGSASTQLNIRVNWDGKTYPDRYRQGTILATASQSADQWYDFTGGGAAHPGGNVLPATGTESGGTPTPVGITVALEAKRAVTSGTGDITSTWDDIEFYHAYVPPAPAVGSPTANSLTVNVNPGGNSTNYEAQFAIKIGSSWVQEGGTVGATPAWLTDAQWDATPVTGLLPNTSYTFEVTARYSSYAPQPTTLLGAGYQTTASTTPEPATLGILALGGLAVLRRRR